MPGPIINSMKQFAMQQIDQTLDQKFRTMNDRVTNLIQSEFQQAINYSAEVRKNMTDMMKDVVQDFRGTIASIEQHILKPGRKGKASPRFSSDQEHSVNSLDEK